MSSQGVVQDWRNRLRDPRFRNRAIIAVVLYIVILYVWGHFVIAMEKRPGQVLNDALLNLIDPVDLTWPTFILTYGLTIGALIATAMNPVRFVVGLYAGGFIILSRIGSMYTIPLEPPEGIIPLRDPFVEAFVSEQVTLLKDLFFSGHTANTFLFYLAVPQRRLKPVFLIGCILVAIFVLFQHVHYSIDVIAAPFFAFACYRISIHLNRDLVRGRPH